MARIHQLHPGNYRSGGNIDNDFANIIRYLVAAEKGDQTLGEMMSVLFDDDGTLIAPVEIRLDTSAGLQYRVGSYDDESDGWETIAAMSSLRGAAGLDLGTIEGPLFSNPQTFTATAAQTTFSYVLDTGADVLVFVDGILQTPDAYTANAATDQVIFDVGLLAGDVVHIVTIRASSVSDYRRSDLTSAGQAVFPFVHTADEQLLVFRNGLLQVAGGGNDYTTSPDSNTITFTTTIPAADVVTILTVENQAEVRVAGLMTEANYTNGAGLIPYSKLLIADAAIPQAKINGLTALLSNRGRTYVSGTEPVSPSTGDVWHDTSSSPTVPKFYDGTQWLRFSAENDLPDFTTSNRNQVLHINSTGTALVWKAVDLSAYVPLSSVGAADGVAALDSTGRLPVSQLPSVLTLDTLTYVATGAIADGNYVIKRIYKEVVRIDARSVRCTSGTATWTLQVDGVDVAGVTASVSSTPSEADLTDSVQVDASSSSKTIGFKISGGAALTGIDLALAIAKETV